jgi:peptidyl-prolyl cis-trans isomerase C
MHSVKPVAGEAQAGVHNGGLATSRFAMVRICVLFTIAALVGLPAGASAADELPPDVLAKSTWTELTRADYESVVAKVPENLRFEFSASPKRVQATLNNLLVTKTLAAQARAHGTRPAASFEPGAGDDSDRALAAAELQRIDADAGKSFDAQKAAFEMKAREIYTLDREKYLTPEEVRISDIAVSIKQRGDEAALARAREARQRIDAGADFAAVAREYSDDPTTRDKGGALPFVTAKALAPDYAKAVFALKTVGAVSEPIKAPSAYHVVRLEERRPPRAKPFEEVSDSIMRDLRARYVTEQHEMRIQAIHEDPSLRINQAAVDSLVNRIDPETMKTPRRSKSREPASK